MEFKMYKRLGYGEMCPYVTGMDLSKVSVSAEDAANGSPQEGDMIARNPNNHNDMWLVSAKYFKENFTLL